MRGKTAAVILAGGSSERMGINKLLAPINGKNALVRCFEIFSESPDIDEIVLVYSSATEALCRELSSGSSKPCAVTAGGAERQDSVRNGVRAAFGANIVAIHDGARCFVSKETIRASVESAKEFGSGVAAVPAKDTIKRAAGGAVKETLDRRELYLIQTPQTFEYDAIAEVCEKAAMLGLTATDDAALLEAVGREVRLVAGSYDNIKLTTIEDMDVANAIATRREGRRESLRVGFGEDLHRLVEGRKLVIGGALFDYDKGLLGHSDADVLAHAVADALLGAAAMGDIGTHFPDTDEKYKGANSMALLREVAGLLRKGGFEIVNTDAVIIAEAPKIMPRADEIRCNLADALSVEKSAISVKATTNEGLDATGRGECISARAVALVRVV